MNNVTISEWVTALRSGKYAQGRLQLRTFDNQFCCLGVLCDLAGVTWVPTNYDYTYWASIGDGNQSFAFPPSPVWQSLGLSEDQLWELVAKNDKGESFEQIATFIETHYGVTDDQSDAATGSADPALRS